MARMRFFLPAALLMFSSTAVPQEIDRGGRSIIEVAPNLKNGEFVWAPQLAPAGTGLLIVNLETQRAVLFRNGIPIGATTVSTGRPGYETPTGVFTILQKHREHYSSTYDNAPMPNMQRLTWKGIALHAGRLPGYPASHGCIRLPPAFAALLFSATQVGMTVVITSVPDTPRTSAPPALGSPAISDDAPLANAPFEWHPERPRKGIVSVIVSIADRRAVVLRGGTEIGSAPVRVRDPGVAATAYVLRAQDSNGQHWLKLRFDGPGQGMDFDPGEEGRKFETPLAFRRAVVDLLRPGSVLIVTPQSLASASTGREQTVIEEEQPPSSR